MTRRNFFANILAAICAILWPKSKKAEYTIGIDPAVGKDETAVVVWDSPAESAFYVGPETGWIIYSTKPRGFIIKENQNG